MDRELIANTYLKGNGIEIGALHNPLKTPQDARVKYVDKRRVAELREQYRELEASPLVPVDIWGLSLRPGQCQRLLRQIFECPSLIPSIIRFASPLR
ncbi:MAG TPA: hypothetical protein VF791_13035 [Pyrinomonadaceae bacterium]